jgi:hypothetical protein
MADSFLSFANSSSFRNQLVARNLQPYAVPGVFSSPPTNVNYETNLTVSSVIDSPDTLISSNQFADSLYPLNEYGPEGGFEGKYSVPGSPYPVESNSGPYDPNDTQLDIINEFFIDAAYVQNIYGPEGGYSDLIVITDVVGNPKLYQPYWDPSSFVASTYTTYDIVFSQNPSGSNGPLSQDTFLARLGAERLKSAFEERIADQLRKETIGRINLDSLEDPFSASLVAAGKQPFVEKNWSITQPENPVEAAAAFALRLSGTYFPVSTIPGDYFNDTNIQAPLLEKALNVGNSLTGGLLGPILDVFRNPSETFVANTGNGQRSILFSSLDYNKYRPKYVRGPLQSITTGLDRILDPDKPNTGGYYVGSPEAEPSQIDSPANQIPVGPGGKQINTIVYGPQELGILYEGNQNKLLNGLKGKSLSDGGGISGQFVWTSPKYKDNAGFKQGPGGVPKSLDQEFETIRSDYSSYQSTDIPFKEGSILDDTQRLIDSADKVTGQSRLKHVGNAINQVSKVFNDGYKELTKGSQVLSYKNDSDGSEEGIEYCRIFTKDTPYYTYADLQKSDGITTEGRKFSYSIFDKTYNLNIAPLKNPGSTNIVDNKVKKYMFSIENLAWRTSDRPGFTYDDLPVCEKGPNGGRIMWFPPYDLSFSDDSSPEFNKTSFLGRPEPIYTYKNTSRKGTISWKIIVDHPAVMNTIVQKQLKKIDPKKVDSMLDSFFAGCLKYDLYELGIKFNTIPTRDLFTYQQVLNNPRLTSEELGQVAFEIPKQPEQADKNVGSSTNADTNVTDNKTKVENNTTNALEDVDLSKFINYGFYFDNDCPECKGSWSKTASQPYDSWYNGYVGNKGKYDTSAPEITYSKESDGTYKEWSRAGIPNFFTQVVEGNFTVIKDTLITNIGEILLNGGEVSVDLVGSASAVQTVAYNQTLSERRIDSVQQWFKKQKDKNGKSFEDYITNKKLILKGDPRGETIAIPKTSSEVTTDATVVNASGNDGVLADSVNCNANLNIKVGNTYKITSAAEIYSIPAMSCRRVTIKDIKAKQPPKKDTGGGGEKTPEPEKETKKEEAVNVQKNPAQTIKPSPNITIEQKIKDGISKKVLRTLFSECDYFEVLKESDPMIFQSIKDKIKYFSPIFHAMTPEGLNGRLTFLNQCVRPGQTIPIIGADGRPKYNDALNTSFGAPPILVLRVGDFYHSKIVPNSLQFAYEEAKYDLNPEGIGVQPMIVKVTLGFDFIGGHGLKQPVEELQNALSFNFYANTEIYDERATATEDVSARDKYVVEKILSQQPPVTTAEIQNTQPKKGGNTIGAILSDTQIDYTSQINDFWKKTTEYFDTVIDTHATLVKNFNRGVVDLLFNERNFNVGKFDEYGTSSELPIYGKPNNVENKVNKLFEETVSDIKKRNDPFMVIIDKSNNLKNTDKKEIERRLIKFVEDSKTEFSLNLNNDLSNLINIQQDYIQNIRKFNLILTKTDGSLTSDNKPLTYNLSADTSSGDTYNLLKTSYTKIKDKHITFFNEPSNIIQNDQLLFLANNKYLPKDALFNDIRTGQPSWVKSDSNINNDDARNRFYQVMAQIFYTDTKKSALKEFILNSQVYSNKTVVGNEIDKAIDDCVKTYNNYTKNNIEVYGKIKNSTAYKDLTQSPLNDADKYVFGYVTTNSGTNDQNKRISDLYSTNNLNNDFKTFDGKVKFN